MSVPAAGPDTLAFSVETAEGRVPLAELDGRAPFTRMACGFAGRAIGLRVTGRSTASGWRAHRPSRWTAASGLPVFKGLPPVGACL